MLDLGLSVWFNRPSAVEKELERRRERRELEMRAQYPARVDDFDHGRAAHVEPGLTMG